LNHYLINKEIQRFSDFQTGGNGISDVMIANERLDDSEIKNCHFDLSTFANVSFKSAKIADASFKHCIFVGCYFRGCQISTVDFTGSKFIDCNFSHSQIRNTVFNYAKFHQCIIPYDEMEMNLPREPNLLRDISRNLKIESMLLGSKSQYLNYYKTEISAIERHLFMIIRRNNSHYKNKYELRHAIAAGLELIKMQLFKHIWGFGEELKPLVTTSLVAIPILFSILYYLLQSYGEILYNGSPAELTFGESVFVSYSSFYNFLGPYQISRGLLLSGLGILQGLINIILFGLFVSCLFKRIKR